MNKISETDIRDIFINCLSQQMSEFELLKSMYPNKDDIILTDNTILEKIQSFINCESEYTPSHLDYTINLHVDKLKIEICVNLPTRYPEEDPDIYIRCNQLNRQQETQLNSGLLSYLGENQAGDVCLYTAISWIQDNVQNLATNVVDIIECQEEKCLSHEKYIRLWIYSHHIYNKKKREEIVKKAKELKLTGFCCPGKPGVVCIEGLDLNCYDWWKDIKSMTWKKISIRKTEELESSQQLKFTNFEEIHADMSKFSKYMETHGLTQAFNEIFRLSYE